MVNRVCAWLVRLAAAAFRALGWRACRFEPTCSEYSTLAFGSFSWPKAWALTARRLLRCHPFCRGGFDPLPEKER
jgi:putative membrane protein insertion efficiency factor